MWCDGLSGTDCAVTDLDPGPGFPFPIVFLQRNAVNFVSASSLTLPSPEIMSTFRVVRINQDAT